MVAYEPWPSPRVVDGPGKGDPRVPAATAAEATRAITAAANTPTIKGRLTAVTSHRVGRPGERPVGPATFLGLFGREGVSILVLLEAGDHEMLWPGVARTPKSPAGQQPRVPKWKPPFGRLPFGGPGSPPPIHRKCGSAARHSRGAAGRPATRLARAG